MTKGQKRLTFTVTPEMAELLDEAKRIFYSNTRSEMIRTLVLTGLADRREQKEQGREDGPPA